jgi:hypothetical protein
LNTLICSKCKESKPETAFSAAPEITRGRRWYCKACVATASRAKRAATKAQPKPDRAAEKAAADASAQATRLASDFSTLRPEDFDVSVGNDDRPGARATSGRAAAEKRQEYNARMGEFLGGIRAAAMGDAPMPPELAAYISNLAEQERRFQNRRDARAVAIFEANEVLAMRRFSMLAERYLAGRIEPVGYARKAPGARKRRTVCALLSDLHLGAELHALDEPVPFRAVEEARRLEYVLRQILDYKPQYREDSEFLLIINGDMIEGQLGHDLRGGAPLAEQKLIFWRLFEQFIGALASAYPRGRVVCQPGNHGRDKMRHPGRATSRKWDSHEWEMYQALRMMSSRLANVEWQIDFRAVSLIDVYGATYAATHADTEVKVGHPDTAASKNASTLDRINATNLYGRSIDAWMFGHYHTGRYHARRPRQIWNAALIPPNGHARTEGYIGEACGQFLWEAVEGYPVGDVRFIEVGVAQDHDERLGGIIQPFRVTD